MSTLIPSKIQIFRVFVEKAMREFSLQTRNMNRRENIVGAQLLADMPKHLFKSFKNFHSSSVFMLSWNQMDNFSNRLCIEI